MNRPLRITLLTVLAVALLAAGALGGYLARGEDPAAPKKPSEVFKASGEPTCWTSGSVLDRVVPAARYADRWKRSTRGKLSHNFQCGVTVDDKQVLRVSVVQRDSVHKPDRVGTGPGHGKTRSVPGYEQSWSSQDAVSLTVPCTKAKGDDGATNLYVKAQAWRENYGGLREDMVRIAKQALKAHHTTTCKVAPGVEDLD
ncbi:hypothetical protein [Streptomyces sp. NPDC048172]|uniref:hypothetical protein n=1 Tax=Streptomyces sp. NPDC048172 TaxID=3365505 RepID=UPI003723EBF0